MKDGCLHCVLLKAAQKWLAAHHAPMEDICKMLGKFTAEVIASLPGHTDQEISIHILGFIHSNRERLH